MPNFGFPTFEPRQREDHLGQQRLLWTPNLFRGPGGSSFRIAEVDQSQCTQRADRKVVPQVVNATSWTPKKNDGFCWWFLSELSMGWIHPWILAKNTKPVAGLSAIFSGMIQVGIWVTHSSFAMFILGYFWSSWSPCAMIIVYESGSSGIQGNHG